MTEADLLEASLGDHRVLARPGPQRGQPLWILDPRATAIWDAAHAGLTAEEISAELAAPFALPLAQTRADVARILSTGDGATAAAHLDPHCH